MDLRKLKGLGPRATAAAVVRKFFYARTTMGYYTVARADATQRVSPGYETHTRAGESVGLAELANPYVDQSDLDALRSQPGARCVLVTKGGEVVASNWYLRGNVAVHELDAVLPLPEGTHYSCRAFVHPDERGQQLVAHMKFAYLTAEPECTVLCCLIHDWNVASIKGVTNAGWSRDGSYRSTRVLGVRLPVRHIT